MFIISNNCCGGMMYRLHKIQFNNPFMWAVVPYRGIQQMLDHFYDINWGRISLDESRLRKKTYVITVDDRFPIHFVHYKLNVNVQTPTVITHGSNQDDDWSSDVEWNSIYRYVVDKYIERVKRMIALKEPPCFLIHEDAFDNEHYKVHLSDLADNSSLYKRIIITTDKSISRNDSICKTILTGVREYHKPSVRQYFEQINNFFSI